MSLVSSGGVIGSIPTGVQFSLSGSTGQQAVSYDSAVRLTPNPLMVSPLLS